MSINSTNDAGQGLFGKEDERTSDELVARTRRAKLTRTTQVERAQDETESASASETLPEHTDDVYNDALLRFGIQI
jgi:hypothetical protein